ncbi:MAG: hypothetical protein EBT57_10565, partial [Verrucomicrobia bacterium]|nr:hypothetical protein [Verrucomicrobiota bacterium]
MRFHSTRKVLASIDAPFFPWSSWSNFLIRWTGVGFLIFLSLTRAIAANYTVNNETDFNNLPRLNAGDVVTLN